MELLITIFTAISNIILGCFVYFKNPKSTTNRLFFILTIIITSWTITNFISLQSSNAVTALFWIRTVMFIVSFWGLIFFLFAKTFPHEQLKIRKSFLFALTAITVITAFLSFSPYMFVNVIIVGKNIQPIPGPAIILFALDSPGLIFTGFCLLVFRYIKSKGLERVQIRFLLFGVGLAFSLLTITNFFFVAIFKISSLVIMGPVFTLFLVGFIAYAIIKHHLWDIRLVVSRTVAYALLLIIFAGSYTASLFAIGTYYMPLKYGQGQLLISAILALLMAFSFQPLRRTLEKATDRIFFRDRYDSHELLADLSKVMAQTLRLSDLTQCTLEKLLTEIRILKGAFILTHDGKIFDQKTIGFKPEPTFQEEDMKLLMTKGEVSFFETLEENDKVKEWMRKHELTVIMPLQTKEEKIGFLLLGDKASGDIYSSEDLKVLEIVSPELTIAIQNAEAYEEIRRFNITLKEEVEKATSDLQAANLKLKELDKLKDDFVSVASHELRTPMTAIRSYVWLALYKPDAPLTEKQKKYLDRTLKSTERLISLVNDMLNVSRIEAGRIEIDPKPFNILDLANEVMEEVASKAGEKTIRLVVENKQLPLLFGDINKIHQVLLNLVGNSLKFTPSNGTIYITFEMKGQFAQISIHDTGTGISKEDLEKLFNKFGRLDNSYTAIGTSGGTGLGLFISKSLVELMHGRVGAFSEGVGKGSTFAFTLPLATPEIIQQSEKYRIKPEGEIKNLEPVAI